MFNETESNRIVMIDDNKDDLDLLSQVFIDNGIGCKTFQYDAFYNQPLKGIRFLFLDINLNGAQSDQDRNSVVRDALVHYLHADNGPFVLIFWTNNIDWIDNFKEFINRSIDDETKNRNPFFLTYIDKNDFYDRADDLKDKVKSIFDNPIVSALFDFEEIMSASIHKAISQIIDIIPKGNLWGDNETFNQNAQKVFSSIAIQTLGYKNAKDNPDTAIKEAMTPMFNHAFLNDSGILWKNALQNLQDSKRQNDISFPDNFNVAKLNHIFHINSYNNISRECRGAICPVSLNTEDNGEFFQKFGYNYSDWFTFSFPNISPEEKESSQLICVEFSAACDHSQQKKRTNKYLLGAILPISAFDKLYNNKKKGDSILLLPNKFEINQEEKAIALNLNFSFTVDVSLKEQTLGMPIFCLKKEMMDMIGNKYANHMSRIGITSFE